MIKHAIYVAIAAIIAAAVLSISMRSEAVDQITRPYQSVRSAGMGGVRITTGLYDENFFWKSSPCHRKSKVESRHAKYHGGDYV